MSSTKKPRKSDKGSKPAVEEPKPSADKAQTQQPEAREVRLRPVEHYQLSAWLFMRGMGLVFLWAFASLYPQIRPLYSAEGVQPVYSHLQLMRDRLGGESKAAVAVPAIFWLSDSFGLDLDTFMYATAFVGMVGSALMLLGSSWTLLVSLVWCDSLIFSLFYDILIDLFVPHSKVLLLELHSRWSDIFVVPVGYSAYRGWIFGSSVLPNVHFHR